MSFLIFNVLNILPDVRPTEDRTIIKNEITLKKVYVNVTGSFKTNSSTYFKKLLSQCILPEEVVRTCFKDYVFDIPCATSVLLELGYTYKEEDEEVLIPPGEFYVRKGGDCEDWSMYYMCFYKHLDVYKIRYAIPGNCTYTLYEKREGNTIVKYVLDDKCPEELILGEYPYVGIACYYVNESRGHCVNIFSKVPLIPDRLNSTNYVLIDPQTGSRTDVPLDDLYILYSEFGLYVRKWGVWG